MSVNDPSAPRAPRIVIVGDGRGGLSAARALAKSDAEVVVIDEGHHGVLQPMVGKFASAWIAATGFAARMLSPQRGRTSVEVILDEIINVDRNTKEVILRDRSIAFDYLVLSTRTARA